eukprot:4058590-Pyramimonas_sp.AAC.1
MGQSVSMVVMFITKTGSDGPERGHLGGALEDGKLPGGDGALLDSQPADGVCARQDPLAAVQHHQGQLRGGDGKLSAGEARDAGARGGDVAHKPRQEQDKNSIRR